MKINLEKIVFRVQKVITYGVVMDLSGDRKIEDLWSMMNRQQAEIEQGDGDPDPGIDGEIKVIGREYVESVERPDYTKPPVPSVEPRHPWALPQYQQK